MRPTIIVLIGPSSSETTTLKDSLCLPEEAILQGCEANMISLPKAFKICSTVLITFEDVCYDDLETILWFAYELRTNLQIIRFQQ
jgi:hypothetical protein